MSHFLLDLRFAFPATASTSLCLRHVHSPVHVPILSLISDREPRTPRIRTPVAHPPDLIHPIRRWSCSPLPQPLPPAHIHPKPFHSRKQTLPYICGRCCSCLLLLLCCCVCRPFGFAWRTAMFRPSTLPFRCPHSHLHLYLYLATLPSGDRRFISRSRGMRFLLVLHAVIGCWH